MKKITLLFAAFVATTFMTAQTTTLSHSTSQVPATGSVACAAQGPPAFTQQNSYWRTYTPANFGFTGDFLVNGAEFGFSFTDSGGNTPVIDVTVNIYTTTGTFPTGTRTMVASQVVQAGTAQNLTVVPVTFATPPTIDSNSEIIVEVNIPSGETAVYGARVAQNAMGENAPSYLSSTGCGNIPPSPISSLGNFPNSHIIVNLVGQSALSVDENILSKVSIYPNPVNEVLNLKNPTNVEITNVVLYDVLGKNTGVQLNNGQLNTAGLSRGVYVLKVSTPAGDFTEKVVKQ